MNKILVVAKNPETYFIKRLIDEVGNDRVVLYNPWKDPAPMGFTQILFRSSGVYHSDVDLAFARTLNTPIMNPLSSLETFRSKSSQYRFFAQEGHPSLPWWWLEKWSAVESIQQYLVKPDRGQGGWGIEVLSARELLSWRERQLSKGDASWIVQPFVQAPEYRVFFMGEERFTLKRTPNPNHLVANFAQEGEAELVTMPEPMRATVERLIRASGAFYGAIDLLETPAGPQFLELNVVPGIEQLEKITGLNIMKLFLTANYFCQIG